MNKVVLQHEHAFRWCRNENLSCKGFLFDHNGHLFQNEELITYFQECVSLEMLLTKLRKANGQFAVVWQQEDRILLATDRLRTFPLFYAENSGGWLVTDEMAVLYHQGCAAMDATAASIFRHTGYVTGEKTLFENAWQVEAGTCVALAAAGRKCVTYHVFQAAVRTWEWQPARAELSRLLAQAGDRMVTLLAGRPVALPLSGGFDSRLLALLLHERHYANVLCFTYGTPQSPEIERARQTAKKLGFPWVFVDYTKFEKVPVLQTPEFEQYYRYASQGVSKFYFSEYFALQYLEREQLISKDTVFIPGHSGDMIAGSHLRPYMRHYRSIDNVVQDIQYQHFQLIKSTWKERKDFRRNIKSELAVDTATPLYQVYENWDLKERQAKYIVNACKLWECNDFQYLIPLWDAELTDFFATLPFDFRLNARLYRDVLGEWFRRKGILYPADSQHIENSISQEIKIKIKRMFPCLRKKHPLFAGDHYHFCKNALPFLQNIDHQEDLLSFNAIFTEWYISQTKKAPF